MTIDKFIDWMSESTIAEKKELALRARTSLSLLYQLGYGTRSASASMAGRIEKSAAVIAKKKRHKPLPVILRGDLAKACAECPYYERCKK